MKLSILIPVYNSEESLINLYDTIKAVLVDDFEVIFINDMSTDNSGMVLDEIKDTCCHVIHLGHNVGQQAAIFIGMRYARGDYILTMDDDLQHDPKDILKLLEKIQSGYQLVYGISSDDYAIYRHLGSRMTANFFRRRFKHMKKKRVSSFRIFTKDLARKCLQSDDRFVYISAIMLGLTESVGQVSVKKHPRPYGKSGYNMVKLVKLFVKLNYYYGPWPNIFKLKGNYNEKTYDFRRG